MYIDEITYAVSCMRNGYDMPKKLSLPDMKDIDYPLVYDDMTALYNNLDTRYLVRDVYRERLWNSRDSIGKQLLDITRYLSLSTKANKATFMRADALMMKTFTEKTLFTAQMYLDKAYVLWTSMSVMDTNSVENMTLLYELFHTRYDIPMNYDLDNFTLETFKSIEPIAIPDSEPGSDSPGPGNSIRVYDEL